MDYMEECLPYILPRYYKRLFPHSLFIKWLSYGKNYNLSNREICFIVSDGGFIRYLSFDDEEEFTKKLQTRNPVEINVGGIYYQPPRYRRVFEVFVPKEHELVFDIDLSDYDDIRTCCIGAKVCLNCWKFMCIACKILDSALREDFGFKHLLWVFSGRRGVHCWVCDRSARVLDSEGREAVAEYIQLVSGGVYINKKVHLGHDKIHSSVKRALKIINEYFETDIVKGQDILGSEKMCKSFLKIIDEGMRGSFEEVIMKENTSEERWKAFINHFDTLFKKQKIPRHLKSLKEEIILQYSYPRLDISVTKDPAHLLRAPFSVHPKTGKVSVPFNPKLVDKFDPNLAPFISTLIDEIKEYDAKVEEQKSNTGDVGEKTGIKCYRKTSLYKSIKVFEEFVQEMEVNSKRNEKNRLVEF